MLKNDKLKLEEVQKRGANMIRETENLSDKKTLKMLKHIWSGEMKVKRKYARELNNERKEKLFSLGAWAGIRINKYKVAMNKVRLQIKK